MITHNIGSLTRLFNLLDIVHILHFSDTYDMDILHLKEGLFDNTNNAFFIDRFSDNNLTCL